MHNHSNRTFIVPDVEFQRVRAVTTLADVIDPTHAPHCLLDALKALGDGTLFDAAADAVSAALGRIPPDLRHAAGK